MPNDGQTAAGTTGGFATTLTKLPQLDAEHLRAITASLPGRLLGRTAALLSLAALLLGWFKLLDWALPPDLLGYRDTHPYLFNAVFYGVPILIVLGQITREWIEARRTKRMRARVIEGAVNDPTYFRLTPYTGSIHDRHRFHRADKAHETLAQLIEQAQAPVFLLTGDSGVGKSSLLEAGALPLLSDSGFHIVSVRGFADPVAAIVDALIADQLIPRANAKDADALSLLRRAARRLIQKDQRLLIIMDQAEELLVVTKEDKRCQFFDLLRQLVADSVPGVVLLLALRSEYEAAFADLGLPPLRHGENWFKLGAFLEPATRTFLNSSGLKLAQGQLEHVLKGAAALEQTRGLYRPIVLNMLGLILARFAGSLPENVDPERLIQHHLRDCIGRAPVAEEARRILPHMITEAGTKWPKRETELGEASHLPLGNVRHCLQTLALPDAGLVRALGHEQAVVWEIAHDFLALQLGLLLGRLKRPLWRRALPYAVPWFAVLWLAAIGGFAAFWPEWAYHRAKSALAEAHFVVEGNRTQGHRIRTVYDSQQGSRATLTAESWQTLLTNLPHLHPVVTLEISGYNTLTSLDGLPALPNLTEMSIISNDALRSLDGLPDLPNLTEMTIQRNYALRSLGGLPALPNLTKMSIASNDALRSLNGLPALPNLTEMTIVSNDALRSLDGLPALPNLTEMSIISNDALRSLDGLPDLPNLTEMTIERNSALTSLGGLPALPNLTEMTIYANAFLTTFDGLPALPNLTEMTIEYNTALRSLDGLPAVPKLETLIIYHQPLPTNLREALPALSSVNRLALNGKDAAKTLETLGQLAELSWILLEDTADMRNAASRLLADRDRNGLARPRIDFASGNDGRWSYPFPPDEDRGKP